MDTAFGSCLSRLFRPFARTAFAGQYVLWMLAAEALVRGLLAAQAASLLGLLSLFLVLSFYVAPPLRFVRTWNKSSAGRMLWIFLPYAAIVLLSLSLRLVLVLTDLRSATSVFVLGPAYRRAPGHHDRRRSGRHLFQSFLADADFGRHSSSFFRCFPRNSSQLLRPGKKPPKCWNAFRMTEPRSAFFPSTKVAGTVAFPVPRTVVFNLRRN